MPYLGTRSTDSKGKAGPYTWMTYAQVTATKLTHRSSHSFTCQQCAQNVQVAETRTHVGSGLLHLGLKPGATVGLYSVNHTGLLQLQVLLPCLTPHASAQMALCISSLLLLLHSSEHRLLMHPFVSSLQAERSPCNACHHAVSSYECSK